MSKHDATSAYRSNWDSVGRRGEVPLVPPYDRDECTLNNKAQACWEQSLNELGDALKTSFKLKANPFKKPQTADEWEPYLNDKRAAVAKLTQQLAEAEINARVYKLFDLTPAEIALLQREVEH